MVLTSEIDLELYPVSDGKPMADSTIHYRWIVTIKENLEVLFANDPMVTVEADMFWYPVPRLRSQPKEERVEPQAPDVMVIFGVPKGDSPKETQSERGSYKQHEEGNIAPQVVFEIYSKSNDMKEWDGKLAFYQQYGVEEYYCIYPEDNLLDVWIREGAILKRAAYGDRWTSPRLDVTFDSSDGVLQLYGPDGRTFTSFSEERKRAKRLEERAKRS